MQICSSSHNHEYHQPIYETMSTGVYPDQFKNCYVHPLLKKSNLDKENLSNYRPISHLSYLSKLTERVVKNRLAGHLNENNLMKNSFQTAYTKFNSTETTLLAVHDHVIRAMSQQQVTGIGGGTGGAEGAPAPPITRLGGHQSLWAPPTRLSHF